MFVAIKPFNSKKMKKIIMIAVVGGAFALTSCKKDYTCECTATDTFWNITYTAEMKKKDAETWCTSWDNSGTGIDGWNCELK